jgi:hypothetical protein
MVDLSKAGTAEQKAYKHTDGAGDDVPTWITLLDDIHRRQLNFPVALWNYNSRPICITSMFPRFGVHMRHKLIRM